MVEKSGIAAFIACYNHGQYLGQAVESLYRQTLRPDRLLIINDASTDNTADVIQERLPSVRYRAYTHKTRQGNIASYREGMVWGLKSPYIHLMAADDFLTDEFYSKAVKIMENEPSVGFVTAPLVWVRGDGTPLGQRSFVPFEGKADPYQVLEAMQRLGNFINGGCTLVRSEMAKIIPPYDFGFEFTADFLYWIRALDYGWAGGFIKEPCMAYRRHDGQMTVIKTPESEREGVQVELSAALNRRRY